MLSFDESYMTVGFGKGNRTAGSSRTNWSRGKAPKLSSPVTKGLSRKAVSVSRNLDGKSWTVFERSTGRLCGHVTRTKGNRYAWRLVGSYTAVGDFLKQRDAVAALLEQL